MSVRAKLATHRNPGLRQFVGMSVSSMGFFVLVRNISPPSGCPPTRGAAVNIFTGDCLWDSVRNHRATLACGGSIPFEKYLL
jgi:hypothetical protein